MKATAFIFCFCFIAGCFFSCSFQKENEDCSFEEALYLVRQTGQNVIVWHVWENGPDTLGYFQKISDRYNKDTLFNRRYVLVRNIMNTVGNEELSYLLQEYRRTLLLEFSSDWELKTVACVEQEQLLPALDSIVQDYSLSQYYKNSFDVPDKSYKSLVSGTLKAYMAFKDGDLRGAADSIGHIVADCPGFFNCYLAAKIYDALKDNEKAVVYARQALPLFKNSNRFLYGSLYEELCFILGEDARTGKEKRNVVFCSTMKDCGRVKYKAPCEMEYIFKNIGETPVIIRHVEKSCNCMEIEWDSKPVLPGETGKIKVSHDANRKGVFSKMLAVFLNDDSQKIFLFYKGQVY